MRRDFLPKKDNSKVLNTALKGGSDVVVYIGEWEDYDVYQFSRRDIYNRNLYTGYPIYYLVGDEESRFATHPECLDIIGHFAKEEDNER